MKKEPIYEKLAPGEALILHRDKKGSIMVAENIDGTIQLRKILKE